MKTAIAMLIYYTLGGMIVAIFGLRAGDAAIATAIAVAPLGVLFFMTTGIWFWFLGAQGGLSKQWKPSWYRKVYGRSAEIGLSLPALVGGPWIWTYRPEPPEANPSPESYRLWQKQMCQFLFAWIVALTGSVALGLLFDLFPQRPC